MPAPEFKPGIRFSTRDGLALAAGALGFLLVWPKVWWGGLLIAMAVGHFFLFCNVFRIGRACELAWAAVFMTLACATVVNGRPSWTATVLGTLAMTVLVVGFELRKASYHGVAWRTFNPRLREWWDESRK